MQLMSFMCFFRWSQLLLEGIVIVFLLLANVGIIIWENYKRVNEIPVKLEKIIHQLRGKLNKRILKQSEPRLGNVG